MGWYGCCCNSPYTCTGGACSGNYSSISISLAGFVSTICSGNAPLVNATHVIEPIVATPCFFGKRIGGYSGLLGHYRRSIALGCQNCFVQQPTTYAGNDFYNINAQIDSTYLTVTINCAQTSEYLSPGVPQVVLDQTIFRWTITGVTNCTEIVGQSIPWISSTMANAADPYNCGWALDGTSATCSVTINA